MDINVDITVTIDGKSYSYEKARAIYEKLHEVFRKSTWDYPYLPYEIPGRPDSTGKKWIRDDNTMTCYNQMQGGN